MAVITSRESAEQDYLGKHVIRITDILTDIINSQHDYLDENTSLTERQKVQLIASGFVTCLGGYLVETGKDYFSKNEKEFNEYINVFVMGLVRIVGDNLEHGKPDTTVVA